MISIFGLMYMKLLRLKIILMMKKNQDGRQQISRLKIG